MTDELKRLRHALDESAPSTDARAKSAAIRAAMAAFEEQKEKNSAIRQEKPAPARPRRQGTKGAGFLKGWITMTTQSLNWKHLAMGGASLAAIAMAAIGLPQLMQDLPGLQGATGQPAGQTAHLPAKKARPRIMAEAQDAMRTPDAMGAPPAAPAPRMRTMARRKMLAPSSAPMGIIAPPELPPAQGYSGQGRDRFTHFDDNPVRLVAENPVSTFSLDVDTASYAFVRSALMNGHLPPRDAVRAEEIVNYFSYDYPAPEDRTRPLRPTVTVAPSPWKQGAKILHIGIKGYEVKNTERPPANLVFLIDTSGSMSAPDKLPLLIRSFRLMLSKLRDDDTVSIVTYAGRAGTALPPTPVKDRARILAALESLTSGGSTAGGEGIRQAYALAARAMKKGGINRVILATDGDFNVGIRDPEQLKDFVARKRKSGITLTVLGFGHGNYNDRLMQALAQNGNGNAHYIDTLNEARKALVEEMGGTLFTIASDAKVQVEFNPATVSQYRLIGYETRKLNREDFNNDKVDAGDIGAGLAVTAIYEFVPRGQRGWLDASRYAPAGRATGGGTSAGGAKGDEYAFVKIRYKLPGEATSRLITRPVTRADEAASLAEAPRDVRFSLAAASYAQLLRGGRYTGAMTWDDVLKLASGARGDDPFGYRAEFLNLVHLAKTASAMELQGK